jgi:hypothetical protein
MAGLVLYLQVRPEDYPRMENLRGALLWLATRPALQIYVYVVKLCEGQTL